ncbi:OR13A protein, partial [Acromyrmex insinuator]
MTRSKEYRSVNITRLFMKVVGLWYVETPKERLLLRVVFGYTVWAIVFAILVEGVDLYHCIGDFYQQNVHMRDKIYLILGTFITHLFKLLRETTLYSASNISLLFVIEPQEKNETEKVLPFKLWIDFPYHSPYYEITYTIQSLSTMHSGICTFCFDNFVSTFNIHAAAQLKILAHKVEVIAEHCIGDTMDQKRPLETDVAVLAFKKLRDCVKQHLTLICYVRNMQRVFAIILLGQLLLSSVVICFGGFQFLSTAKLKILEKILKIFMIIKNIKLKKIIVNFINTKKINIISFSKIFSLTFLFLFKIFPKKFIYCKL